MFCIELASPTQQTRIRQSTSCFSNATNLSLQICNCKLISRLLLIVILLSPRAYDQR